MHTCKYLKPKPPHHSFILVFPSRRTRWQPAPRLAYLELIDCDALMQMPDLSKCEELVVEMTGCDRELARMWEAGGQKPYNAAFA